MAISTGSRSYVAYITETVAGTTPVTPAFKGVPFTGTTLNLTRGGISDPSLRSDRMKRYFRLGNRTVGGNISVSYAPGTYDDFLEATCMGLWATNVLKVGTTVRTFSMEIGHLDVTQFRTFTGCAMGGLTLNVPSGNTLVTGEFEVMGMNGAIAATTLDSDSTIDYAGTTGTPFVHLDATFLEGGVAIGYLTGVQVKIDNSLTVNYAAGSAGARAITSGMSLITGQVTAYFESAALFAKWFAETTTSLSFTLVSGAKSQAWLMPNVRYTASTIPVSGDGPVIQTLTFEALFDAVTGTTLQITRVP